MAEERKKGTETKTWTEAVESIETKLAEQVVEIAIDHAEKNALEEFREAVEANTSRFGFEIPREKVEAVFEAAKGLFKFPPEVRVRLREQITGHPPQSRSVGSATERYEYVDGSLSKLP